MSAIKPPNTYPPPNRPRTRKNWGRAAHDAVLQICRDYMYRKDGCERGEQCNYLHICRYFILESCRRGPGSCPFSHDLQSGQPQHLLQRRFEISKLEGDELQNFKFLFGATIRRPPKIKSSEFDDAQEEENSILNNENLKTFLASFKNKSSHPQQVFNMKTTQICPQYLRGKCYFKSKNQCNFYHCDTAFQWQIHQHGGLDWTDLVRQSNKGMEECYCDVNNKYYQGIILTCDDNDGNFASEVIITFEADGSLTGHDVNGDKLNVRRLSTPSNILFEGSLKNCCTQWTWYFKDRSDRWTQHTEEIAFKIERTYLDYKLRKVSADWYRFTMGNNLLVINFSCMTQNRLWGDLVAVARRPKYTEQTPSLGNQLKSKTDARQLTCALQKVSNVKDQTKARHYRSVNILSPLTESQIKAPPSKESQKAVLQSKVSQPESVVSLRSSGVEMTPESLPERLKCPEDSSKEKENPLKISSETQQVVRPKDQKCVPHTTQDKCDCDDTPVASQPPPHQTDALSICTKHFRLGECEFDQDPHNSNHSGRHFDAPFQWQFEKQSLWQDLTKSGNEAVEKAFCDVNTRVYISRSDSVKMHFDLDPMVAIQSSVRYNARRLSTPSSILKTNWEQAFCIEWLWYWYEKTNTWIVYSQKNIIGRKAGIDSATIEQKHLDYESKQGASKISFTAGDHSYELDFTTMQQRNVKYGTCRAVRRRPKFVSMEDRVTISEHMSRSRKDCVVMPTLHLPDCMVPTTWVNPGTQTDMRLVNITDYSSPEYITLASLFWDTMGDCANICSIQRVQNLELWEDFSRMRERMRKKNMGQPVFQKRLFHGTKKAHCDAICRQNFDWRLSGTNVGTLYGKGSYFATDASYAHSYTEPDNDDRRYVFVAQVLIGTYASGNKSFVRPPSKDRNPHGELYDSCVDDIRNPHIFVVFEKMQVYPEYLIEYYLNTKQMQSGRGLTQNYSPYNYFVPSSTTTGSQQSPPTSLYQAGPTVNYHVPNSLATASKTHKFSTPSSKNRCSIQ